MNQWDHLLLAMYHLLARIPVWHDRDKSNIHRNVSGLVTLLSKFGKGPLQN